MPVEYTRRAPRIEMCEHCQYVSSGLKRNSSSHNHPGLQYNLSFQKGCYIDLATQRSYVRPDVCIALNAGVHLYEKGSANDTWDTTLQAIRQMHIPFGVTSYGHEEAVQDAARLESYGFDWLLECRKNPFKSLMPQREPTPLNQSSFYFHNSHVMVAIGGDNSNNNTRTEGSEPSEPSEGKNLKQAEKKKVVQRVEVKQSTSVNLRTVVLSGDKWRKQEEKLPHLDLIRKSQR